MENRKVGWLIIGIGLAVAAIVMIFNLGLKKIVGETCPHGPTCTMYDTIAVQTWLSLSVVLIIIAIGIIIMYSKPDEKIVVRKVKDKKKKINMENLDRDERKVVELLVKENKAMFQADLMEKMEIGKVKMTRLLDKLESKQIVERKRRGMNNIVVLRI